MNHRIGVVAPFDTQSDREFWRWTPETASLHFTRTPYKEGPVSVALAEATADPDDLQVAVESIVKIEPAVVVFACTSGSFVGGLAGERALRATMESAGARRAV